MPARQKPSCSSRRRPALAAPQLDAVAALFAVLSEPSRLRIIHALQAGPLSVGGLVDLLQMKQANVSKQLGILQTAGVIARRRQGNRAIYSIDMPLVFNLCQLVCRDLAHHLADRAAQLRGESQ